MSARTYLGFLPWIVFAFVARGVARRRRVGRRRRPAHRGRHRRRLGPDPVGQGARDLLDRPVRRVRGRRRLQPARSPGLPPALPQRARGRGARAASRSPRWPSSRSPSSTPGSSSSGSTGTPRRFNRANVELTLMWAVVFVAIAASEITAGALETRLGATIFNWIVPVGLVLLGRPAGLAALERPVRRRVDGPRRDAEPGRALGPSASRPAAISNSSVPNRSISLPA